MMTYASGTDSAAGARRFILSEVDCPKSCVCRQNRLRSLLQVHLRQLEHERRATFARISHAQRQFQQRFAPKLDRRASVPHVRVDTRSCPDEERVGEHSNQHDNDGETSNCECACCRYGLWTGRNRPADVGLSLGKETPTPTRHLGRSVTLCPVVESRPRRLSDRRTTAARLYDDDATKRFNANTGAIRRSKTSI